MSATKVDPLAIGVDSALRNCATYLSDSGLADAAAQVEAVRAAVAELVEECERLCAAADGPVAQSMRISAKNILRLRPALARIGGQP